MESSSNEGNGLRPPDQVVGEVADTGERVLWTGRPDTQALLDGLSRRRIHPLTGSLLVGVAAVAAVFLAGNRGFDPSGLWDQILEDGGWVFVLAAVGILLVPALLRIGGLGGSRADRHLRWARSLTYGITDRRLLILEGEEIAWACQPDDLGPVRIRERTQTHADLVLKEGSSSGRRETVYSRDRRRIAFKALPDAEHIKEVVERWRDAHRIGAERQVATFLEGPVGLSDEVAVGERVQNPAYGFAVTFPEGWDIRVRRRSKPFGKIAFEFGGWQPLGSVSDWNAIRAEGPYHTSVEIHLDAVPEPTLTLREATESWLYKSLAGELLDTDDSVTWGRFEGFSSTRRHIEHGPDQTAEDIERPAIMRNTVLHDGSVQVAIVATWPEGSDPLRATVDKVVDEMTLGELGESARVALAPSESGFARVLVALGRGLRVLVGLLVLALATWAASDQAARVAGGAGPGSSTWMWYAVAGVMLMLRPLALPFEAFRGFTRAPFGKRLLMTFGIAVAVVLVIAVMVR